MSVILPKQSDLRAMSWQPPSAFTEPEKAAEAWVLRLVSGEATEADAHLLDTWLKASSANQRAFNQARALWHTARDLPPMPIRKAASQTRWRPLVATGMASAFVVLLAWLALPPLVDFSADYRTPTGEIRRVGLPDGSVAWLDTGTALKLADSSGRHIQLLHGQAWFSVRHDAKHPFQVAARDGVITDVGTEFTVRDNADAVEVAVAQGSVRVTWDGHAAIATAGEDLSYGAQNSLITHKTAAPDAAFGWRNRTLTFDGASLKSVLGELQRYRGGAILLLDKSASQKPISAVIAMNRLDAGLDALAESQGLRIYRMPFLAILTAASAKKSGDQG